VAWNGTPLAPDRPLPQRLREPESGLGSGWATWLYSNHPELFRHLPENTRVYRARTALGPAGASWLRDRVVGQFPVLTGQTVTSAKAHDGRVRLSVTASSGPSRELDCDHVVAATGYRTDLARLDFLSTAVRSGLRTLVGSPVVDHGYQSSVPGLYFVGTAVAPTMGPVMRFVYGTRHAAPAVARQVASFPRRNIRAAEAASR
jgi:thioredoxin reductase